MAEVAAGLIVAEQVVSTTIEGGAIAGYAIAKDTMPLKATFTQLAKSSQDSPLALARSHHSLTVLGDKAYIFGGEVSDGELASTDIHAVTLTPTQDTEVDYACTPAISHEEGGDVPVARTRHATCSRGKHLVLLGGCDASGKATEDDCALWLWDPETLKWQKVHKRSSEDKLEIGQASEQHESAPCARFDHSIFTYKDVLILYGGKSSSNEQLKDTWLFNFSSRFWSKLHDAPEVANSVTFVEDTLYIITGASPVSSSAHYLRLMDSEFHSTPTHTPWQTTTFPTNPLTPGPQPRTGAGFLPVTTGYGRLYLLYLFGAREAASTLGATDEKEPEKDTSAPYWSDIWTYQVESKSVKPTSWTDLKPAAIKDTIRHKLGYDSGGHSWAEVEVLANEQTGHEGKVHPGPRGFFGADVLEGGKGVVIWGGINARGEREGDGWLIKLQ